MKVRYGSFRVKGEDFTGREVEMDDEEARVLIESNIVVPVEEPAIIESASLEPPETAMLKPPVKKKANGKRSISGKR